MKTLAIILTALGLVCQAGATAQMGERLLYKGETNRLCTLPLEPYLKAHNLRLYNLAPPKQFIMSTGCWRGYLGTWQIKDGFLWLVSVEHLDRTPVPLSKLFPDQAPPARTNQTASFSADGKKIITVDQETPVKATWFSGTLHVTQGKMLRYVHAEFASQFERNVFIDIQNGKVTGERVQENKAGP